MQWSADYTFKEYEQPGPQVKYEVTVDLQGLFGLHLHSCTHHWLRPRNPPSHLGSYTSALLVSQDRRHLFGDPSSRILKVLYLNHALKPIN